MRVAILNHPPAERGGDQVALDYLIPALKREGPEVEHVWGSGLAEKLSGFDLAHIFHINCCHCGHNFEAAKMAGIPYVVTPIFYPELLEMPRNGQAGWIAGARAVMPVSNAEREEVIKELGTEFRCVVIPNGTDPKFHAEPSDDRVGVCAEDWNGTKFTDTIKLACEALGIPFTRLYGTPHEQMPYILRTFRVYSSASRSDRMSLSVGEALCAGCRVLSSSANRGNEWYFGLETIDPLSPHHVWMDRIADAYHSPKWDCAPNEAARKLTWGGTAKKTAEVYREALA